MSPTPSFDQPLRINPPMMTNAPDHEAPEWRESVVQWLLDSDPSIRWQVMRDLMEESDEVVSEERSRVASHGWGARLLDLQAPEGPWGDGTQFPQWQTTTCTLVLLKEMGLDPSNERARTAIGLVRDHYTWGPEFDNSPYFEGEVEPCINGRVVALGAYFGETRDRLVDRLLREQLDDGGWNCEAPPSTRSSFHSTICVLEGLLEYEKATGTATAVRDARLRAHEYLLKRRMFRSLRTNEVIDPDWTRFSYPTYWHYDVLRGLDYLRKADIPFDQRLAEAVNLVASQRDSAGRWPLENPHAGEVLVEMENRLGQSSRWNTLRAMRVLDWYSARD
jgi:hypothetical protein